MLLAYVMIGLTYANPNTPGESMLVMLSIVIGSIIFVVNFGTMMSKSLNKAYKMVKDKLIKRK